MLVKNRPAYPLQFLIDAFKDTPLLSEVIDHRTKLCIGSKGAVETNK